jgi:hypothetical protein
MLEKLLFESHHPGKIEILGFLIHTRKIVVRTSEFPADQSQAVQVTTNCGVNLYKKIAA